MVLGGSSLKRLFGVAIISFFYIFGAVVLIYTSIFYHPNADQFGIAARFGVLALPEQPMKLIVAVIYTLSTVLGTNVWNGLLSV